MLRRVNLVSLEMPRKISKNRFVKMYLHSICVHIQTCECVTIVDSVPKLIASQKYILVLK